MCGAVDSDTKQLWHMNIMAQHVTVQICVIAE